MVESVLNFYLAFLNDFGFEMDGLYYHFEAKMSSFFWGGLVGENVFLDFGDSGIVFPKFVGS